MGARMRSLTAV